MKFPIILFSACFVATLLNVGLAVLQTAGTKRVDPSQTVSVRHQQAMDECKERYGGGIARGHLGRDRYAYMEACFKQLTGVYPFQVNVNLLRPFQEQRHPLLIFAGEACGWRVGEGGAGTKGRDGPAPQPARCAPSSGASTIAFVRL